MKETPARHGGVTRHSFTITRRANWTVRKAKQANPRPQRRKKSLTLQKKKSVDADTFTNTATGFGRIATRLEFCLRWL